MGRHDEVIRYRLGTGWLAAYLALGVLPVAACLIAAARFDDWSVLPLVIGIAVVTIPTATWAAVSTGVTLTPSAVVIGTPLRRSTISWPDISTIDWRGRELWVMSREGWFLLPVPAGSRATSADALVLAQRLHEAWVRGRGEGWQPAVLAPWNPTRDLRGRVVLRHHVGPKVVIVAYLVATFAAQIPFVVGTSSSFDLATAIVGRLAVVGVGIALLAIHQAWARTTIDEHEVVIRSFLGISRFPLDSIAAVREEPTRNPDRCRLVLDQLTRTAVPVERTILRSARLPVTGGRSALGNDPAYHRKWAWLHDHVVRTPGTAHHIPAGAAPSPDGAGWPSP